MSSHRRTISCRICHCAGETQGGRRRGEIYRAERNRWHGKGGVRERLSCRKTRGERREDRERNVAQGFWLGGKIAPEESSSWEAGWAQTRLIFIWRHAFFPQHPSIMVSTNSDSTHTAPVGLLTENISRTAELLLSWTHINKHTMQEAVPIRKANMCIGDKGRIGFICVDLFACNVYIYLYILYLKLLMWLCAYLCMCVCAHSQTCVFVCSCYFVCVSVVMLEWNMNILPLSWIHRNGLGPGSQGSI